MTDKVQKIREEVERMHNLLPVMDGDNIYLNYADRICTTLEMFIDSLQEEPVNKQKLSNVEKTVKDWKEEPIIEVLDRYLDRVPDEEVLKTKIAINEWFNVYFPKLQEEPVSEDLTDEIKSWLKQWGENEMEWSYEDIWDTAEHFANWQKEQMMKDATKVTVHIEAGNYPYIPQLELYDYDRDEPLAKKGDKYKVILIKED